MAQQVRDSRSVSARWLPSVLLVLLALVGGVLLTGSAPTPAAAQAVGGDGYQSAGQLSSAATSSYSIMQVTLNSGRSVDARWNPCQSAITYRVNLSGLPRAQRRAMLRTISASFRRLHAATGLTYRYRGTTRFVPRQGNLAEQPAEIVVAAVPRSRTDLPMTAASLGYGGVLWSTWYGDQGEGAAVMRGYVVLEADAISTLRRGWGSGTRLTNVVLHELAHASGLDHVSDRRQQMYPTLSTGSPSGFAAGDLAGLARVGAQAGCISVPDHVSLEDLD